MEVTKRIKKIKATIEKDGVKNIPALQSAFSKLNAGTILKYIVDGFIFITNTFFKPFWFSSNKKSIIVPYLYTSVNMGLFYISIYIFLTLSYKAALVGITSPEIVLPTLAGVIATLIALNHSMLSIYNNGKNRNNPEDITNKEEDKTPKTQ